MKSYIKAIIIFNKKGEKRVVPLKQVGQLKQVNRGGDSYIWFCHISYRVG